MREGRMTATIAHVLRVTAKEFFGWEVAMEGWDVIGEVDASDDPVPFVAGDSPLDFHYRLAMELMGVVIDVEQGHGFDAVCLETIKRVRDELLIRSKSETTP
jgi:hypothetical protein